MVYDCFCSFSDTWGRSWIDFLHLVVLSFQGLASPREAIAVEVGFGPEGSRHFISETESATRELQQHVASRPSYGPGPGFPLVCEAMGSWPSSRRGGVAAS